MIDKMTLKFNLATCFARMSSRMELSWNESTGAEKGVMQASYLYQKSAGVFMDIKTELLKLKHTLEKSIWRQFKDACCTDLQIKTVSMLQLIMNAQA